MGTVKRSFSNHTMDKAESSGKGYLCGGGRDLTQWILRKRFGHGEKDNPLLDFSERA